MIRCLSIIILFLVLGSEYCSFDEIQRRGMDSLKQALLKTIEESQKKSDLHWDSTSGVKQISVSSVVNKRRRQEDRWFFEPDMINYAPVNKVVIILLIISVICHDAFKVTFVRVVNASQFLRSNRRYWNISFRHISVLLLDILMISRYYGYH